MAFFDYLKNIFLLLLILQIAPPMLENLKKQWRALSEPRSKVAVIEIKGAFNNVDSYQKQLYTYFKDPAIRAILLKMDCQGGSSGSAQSLYQEILTLKKEFSKPIVTLIENVCTSAGYYVACATDYIISPGSALVGSIGTSFPYLFKTKNFLEQFKISNESLKAGTYKDAINPFVDMRPEDKAMLQNVLDNAYKQFTHDVAFSRKLSLSSVDIWANGRLFTALQAQELGLIDAIGSSSLITTLIKKKALIEGEIEWVHKKESSVLTRILGSEEQDENSTLFATQSYFMIHSIHALLSALIPAAFPFAE